MWAGLVCCLAVSFCPTFCSSTAKSGLLNRPNQKPIHSHCSWELWKHVLNLNWAALLSERASRRRREEDRISLCSVLCFPTRICQRNERKPETKQLRVRTRVGWGETAPNLFVLFLMFTVLPELVNHIGSLSYHSILTKWWYFLNFVYSQNCWGVLAEGVLLSFVFFFLGGGWR